MNAEQILESIDAKIERLEELKKLLMGSNGASAPTTRGRPAKAVAKKAAMKTPGKRTMSAKGRARIAAAQKARWAKAKRVKSA